MQFSRSQIIIISSIVFVVLLFAGIFTGVLPGTRNIGEKPPQMDLVVWGIENGAFFQENLSKYETLRTNVKVDYEEKNPTTYEKDLIDALAAGKGPDIIMFHNSWLPKHYNKIVPVEDIQLTLKALKETFPTAIEQDFAPDGKIYALPLYIDSLALFYNQDIFDKLGIALPPKDWLEFQNLIPKIRQKDASGKITRAAAAIGGSNDSVDKGSDLLMLLMLQAGTKMTNDEFTQTTFTENINGLLPGTDALNFYTKFTKPNEIFYAWNDGLTYSLDGFAKGETAMIFNYASEKETIKAKNPFLNFKVAPMPQISDKEKAVNYPDYWGLAVTNNSKNPQWAWDLILYLTANEEIAENYLEISDQPPALRSLIQKYTEHPELGIFAKQALSARSWPQIDKTAIANIFSETIKAVINNNLEPMDALYQAEREVTDLMVTK